MDSALKPLICLVITIGIGFRVVGFEVFEQPPIEYSKGTPSGPVAQLVQKLDQGELVLNRESEQGFLRDLMRVLDIPEASQVLVYSKTSHQNSRIRPSTPRAVYFNEEVYMGWVQGGMVELASMSPGLGMVFYVLDHRSAQGPITIERTASCLSCHAGSRVNDMPGVMVRSVYPDANGYPILSEGSFVTTHASPFKERWGGWYVTGSHGSGRHLGNVTFTLTESGLDYDTESGANVEELETFFDTGPYLRKGSDIVALMVLEHQTEMHNILNQAAYSMRIVMHRQAGLSKELDLPQSEELSGSSLVVAQGQTEKILKYLLFCDEAPLPQGGVEGHPAFQEAFQRNARRNDDGRSLKDFQLLNRLFKYRCSYMIYSTAFDLLPDPLKRMVYRRLKEILDGKDESGDYDHLSASERRYIKDILMETKTDIQTEWKH